MQRGRPNPILIGLIVFLLSWVLQYLARGVLGLNFTITLPTDRVMTEQQLMEFYHSVYQEFLDHFHPTIFSGLIAAALLVMNLVVNVGLTIFSLHTTRGEKAEYGNLLDGFPIILRVVVLTVIRGALVYLGFFLFVVPGVVLLYRYRQSLYLLIDHPERSPIECMRASAVLMQGHKRELFLLDLSFLGWILLSMIAMQLFYVPLYVLLWPYQKLTYANYYRSLLGEPVPVDAGSNPSEEDDPKEGPF